MLAILHLEKLGKGANMRIAIIGAGIGGLAAACGLRRAGARVSVFERADTVRADGFALSIFTNGFQALEAVGVGGWAPGVASSGSAALPSGIRDPRGRWLARFGPAVVDAATLVRRDALHERLCSPIADAIRCGVEVTNVDGDHLGFADGAGEGPFDVIVGADGLHSRVRGGFSADPGTRFSGYHAWRGITDRAAALEGLGELWGHGRRFGVTRLSDGCSYWFATIDGSEESTPPARLDAVREAFHGWHSDVESVLAATPSTSVSALQIRDLARPLPSFIEGRAVLLGDAAHAMTPNLGQGANQALEDAAQLSALLAPIAEFADPAPRAVTAALARYDRLRRPRTQAIAARSWHMGRVGQLGGVAAHLRDLGLRCVPNRVLDHGARSALDWRPES